MAVEPDREPGELHGKWQYGRLVPMPAAVPTGWSFGKLTDVARLESGHTPSRKHPEYWTGDIPWVSLHDSKGLDRAVIDTTAQTIGELGLANSSARMLPAGTVVFSRTATVGKATILGRDMATSQDFANYICGPDIHNQFLMHLLRFLQPEWKRLMAGSTHNTIYMPIFENLEVLLPPAGEQMKIAAVLASVDEAIEATQAVIEQLQIVKKAMMAELLTRGLPGRHTRFKQTDIGEMPVEWELTSLQNLCGADGLQTGPFGSQLKASEYTPTGVPVVMPRDIREQAFVSDSIARIPEARAATLAQHRVEIGDILFGRRGDIGRCALVRDAQKGWVCGTGCLRARPGTRIHGEFLVRWLSTEPLVAWLTDHAVGQTMLNLNTAILGGLPVAVPSPGEQRVIAECLASIEDSVRANRDCREGIKSVKSALMSVLLTGEVRVKPDPEPA